MSELEKNAFETRNSVNKAIKQLAIAAMEDSTNYRSAIEKLKHFKWTSIGPVGSMIIDLAIEFVERQALEAPIEKNC